MPGTVSASTTWSFESTLSSRTRAGSSLSRNTAIGPRRRRATPSVMRYNSTPGATASAGPRPPDGRVPAHPHTIATRTATLQSRALRLIDWSILSRHGAPRFPAPGQHRPGIHGTDRLAGGPHLAQPRRPNRGRASGRARFAPATPSASSRRRPPPTSRSSSTSSANRSRALGLKVKIGRHVMDRHGSLGGTDKDRAADINRFFADRRRARDHPDARRLGQRAAAAAARLRRPSRPESEDHARLQRHHGAAERHSRAHRPRHVSRPERRRPVGQTTRSTG